jgi:VWFA-related protein
VFDLPPMSPEERAKYVALQADAPTLSAPAARSSADSSRTANEEVFDVADQSNSEEPPKAPVIAAPGAAPPDASASGGIPTATAVSKPDPADTGSADSSAVTFKVASKTVVVDVVVTDSKGHTVKGLPAQGFQVQEDGKPQRVNYFHEFAGYSGPDNSAATPMAAATPEAKLPPNVFTNNQLTREDEPITVFLLDLLNTPQQAQWYAKEQLIRFLKNKPKGSQFALCTLTNGLRLIQGFTSDETLLIVTANGQKGATRDNPLMENDIGLKKGLQMQQDLAGLDPNAEFVVRMFQQAQAEERTDELDRRVSITVDAFVQLARYLSGVPGRKNVVWLSGSFPLGIFPDSDLTSSFSEMRNYAQTMKKAANLLADAHVAVYPVDVRGLMGQSVLTASNNLGQPPPIPGSMAPTGGQNSAAMLQNTATNVPAATPISQATHEDLESQVGDQSTMDQIAADTGGKAFYNTNGITEAIHTAVEQGSEYYMLSYTPANRNYDGKFRKLKVALAAKGYHLAYRRGYYADDPLAPITEEKDALSRDVGMAAMQHGSPQSHQIVFATRIVPVGKPVKVDPAKHSAAGRKPKKNAVVITEVQHYAVDYAIAGPQLHSVDQGSMHHGVLAFMASAFDDDGKQLSRVASRTTSDLKAPSYRDVMVGGFRLHQEFDVPVNAVSLRLGVEDELNRRLGTVAISLPVPPPPEEAGLHAKTLPEIAPD